VLNGGVGDRSARAATVAAAVILLAGAIAGGRAMVREIALRHRIGPQRVVADSVLETVREVDRAVPAGQPLVFLTSSEDSWRCGIWQRLLSRRTVACVRTPLPAFEEELSRVRAGLGPEWVVAEAEAADRIAWGWRRDLPHGFVLGRFAP
jgi:hypothetical protein